MRRRTFVNESVSSLIADEPIFESDVAIVRFSRRAMATRFEVCLPYGTPNALGAAEAALDEIDECERWMTVYDDESEVCRLNQNAYHSAVEVSEPLVNLLSVSLEMVAHTGGAFDPAIGAMIKAWGFYRREGRLPTTAERARAMAASGMRHVAFDHVNRTVKFLRPGIELNFGSIGKGFALDRAADVLTRQFGITTALLQGGGSSVRVLGTPPGLSKGWPIRVTHPDPGQPPIRTIDMSHGGFATSAATFQFFEYKGRRYGHVLDPRTGRPAAGTSSASVATSTAAKADALSTAAFVVGAEASARMLKSLPDTDAIVLSDDAHPATLPGCS